MILAIQGFISLSDLSQEKRIYILYSRVHKERKMQTHLKYSRNWKFLLEPGSAAQRLSGYKPDYYP